MGEDTALIETVWPLTPEIRAFLDMMRSRASIEQGLRKELEFCQEYISKMKYQMQGLERSKAKLVNHNDRLRAMVAQLRQEKADLEGDHGFDGFGFD